MGCELLQVLSSAVAEMGDRLATTDMGRKLEGGCAPFFGGRGLGPRLERSGLGRGLPPYQSGILIHPTVWPQNTNVTGPIAERTVLQMVTQKRRQVGRRSTNTSL